MLMMPLIMGLIAIASTATASPGQVEVVTGELANEIVGPWDKDPVLFVITFTRDTPECRILAVDIEEAAKATESNPSIRFVTVDIDRHPDFAQAFDVTSAPEVQAMKKIPGQITVAETFNGDLVLDSILELVLTMAEPDYPIAEDLTTTLTSDTFQGFVEAQKITPILLYTSDPSCTDCKDARAEVMITAQSLRDDFGISVKVGRLNCADAKEICASLGIKTRLLPEVLFFKGTIAKFDSYLGELYHEEMLDVFVPELQSMSRLLDTETAVQSAIDSMNASVIAYIKNDDSFTHNLGIYEHGLASFRFEHDIFVVNRRSLLDQFSPYPDHPTIVVYADSRFRSEWSPADYGDVFEAATQFHMFMKEALRQVAPAVGLKTRKDPNVGLELGLHHNTHPHLRVEDGGYPYTGSRLPRIEVYFNIDYSTPEAFNRTRAQWEEISQIQQQFAKVQLPFVIGSDVEYKTELEQAWGLGDLLNRDVKAIGFSGGDRVGQRYVMTQSHTLLSFTESFMYSGDMKPHVRTGKVPKKPYVGHVREVVATNFAKVVEDWKKDVLILLYSSTATDVNQVTEIWEELAEQMKDVPNLVVARMDMAMNDVPVGSEEFDIDEGLPTIYLAPRGDDLPAALHIQVVGAKFSDMRPAQLLELLKPSEGGIKMPKITHTDNKDEGGDAAGAASLPAGVTIEIRDDNDNDDEDSAHTEL
eukprot:m.60288 g.60288  ORF g.60288 m.60288 type:complete len:701 (+) comp7947_c0_seq2:82-2184(+)